MLTKTTSTLNNIRFSEADLVEVDFTSSSLSDVCFDGVNLENASFSESTLSNVVFLCSDLSKANFTKSQLWNVSFTDVNLNESNFSGSHLSRVNFRGNIFPKAPFRSSYISRFYSPMMIRSAILEDVFMEDCSFLKTVLTGSKLTRSSLHRTTFEEASLYRCDLNLAEFLGCEFTSSSINASHIEYTDFSRSLFEKTRIQRVKGLITAKFVDVVISNCLSTKSDLYKILDGVGCLERSTRDSARIVRDRKEESGLLLPIRASDGSRIEEKYQPQLCLDLNEIESKIKESTEVDKLLGEIFQEESNLENYVYPVVENKRTLLDEDHLRFLYVLEEKEVWSRSELSSIAHTIGLMLNSALENINEVAIEACDEILTYGEDPIEIDIEILEQLLP